MKKAHCFLVWTGVRLPAAPQGIKNEHLKGVRFLFTPPHSSPKRLRWGESLHSTVRRFVGCPCRPPAKDHFFPEIPSSFVQHVKELTCPFTSGHTPRQPGENL